MSIDRRERNGLDRHWRKSSYSAGDGGECVEVARTTRAVHVRDSKDRHGTRLSFGRAEWAEFLSFVTGLSSDGPARRDG